MNPLLSNSRISHKIEAKLVYRQLASPSAAAGAQTGTPGAVAFLYGISSCSKAMLLAKGPDSIAGYCSGSIPIDQRQGIGATDPYA